MIQEWDFVMEHEIAPNTMVSLSWIGSLGHFLPEAVDTNLPAPTTATYNISGGSLAGDAGVGIELERGQRGMRLHRRVSYFICDKARLGHLVGFGKTFGGIAEDVVVILFQIAGLRFMDKVRLGLHRLFGIEVRGQDFVLDVD